MSESELLITANNCIKSESIENSIMCKSESESNNNNNNNENGSSNSGSSGNKATRKRLSSDQEPQEIDHESKQIKTNQNGSSIAVKSEESDTGKSKTGGAVFNHDSEAQRVRAACGKAAATGSSGGGPQSGALGNKDFLYKYMYVEKYENGGGYILHAYQDELGELDQADLDLFINRYYKCLFRETQHNNNHPYSLYCIGIIHAAARKLPELLSYLADRYEHIAVKTNVMEFKNDIQTVTMGDYATNVYRNYKNGLYRYGPLHAVSLVGTKGEETGGYFKDVIRHLERIPWLRPVMPWGSLSQLAGCSPTSSNDGPILWMRHGEQAVPCHSGSAGGGIGYGVGDRGTGNKKRRNSPNTNMTAPIMNLPTTIRGGVTRQTVVHDRTHCHADHADDGLDRHTTAAVGVLKAIHPPNTKVKNGNYRVVKDVVCFDPRHYSDLIKRLKLDIMEPPASQCGNYWADDAELNQLRMEGYRFIRVWLRDNDIYFIPRNVVHQFKTVSAVSSVAWHVRLRRYYHIPSSTPGAKSTEDNQNYPLSSAASVNNSVNK